MFEDITNSLQKVLDQLLSTLPSLIGAIVILFIGWLLAKLLSRIVARVLRRIGLDKLADKLNNTETFQESNITIRPVIIIEKFLYYTLIFITLLSASEVLGMDLLSEQIGSLIAYIPNLLTALVILAVGFYIADSVKQLVANTAQSFGIPAWRFIGGTVFVLIMLVVAVTALDQARIDTSMVRQNATVILGGIMLAFAVAYGYAARGVLRSMLGAYYSRGSYQIGQTIELEGHVGTIVRMDKVSFSIDTGEKYVVFPMERLLSDTVIIHRPK